LPFQGDKGDALIVRIPGVHFDKIIKHKVFIVPLEEDRYWIGATYVRQFDTEAPTEAGRRELIRRLRATLKVPFEVVEHRAAVRPTVRDRRPFLGVHPQFPQLAIFNGLGTKGASLGPFFARRMVDFLTKNEQLEAAVNIERFRSSYDEAVSAS
jgi:glycine oxidase